MDYETTVSLLDKQRQIKYLLKELAKNWQLPSNKWPRLGLHNHEFASRYQGLLGIQIDGIQAPDSVPLQSEILKAFRRSELMHRLKRFFFLALHRRCQIRGDSASCHYKWEWYYLGTWRLPNARVRSMKAPRIGFLVLLSAESWSHVCGWYWPFPVLWCLCLLLFMWKGAIGTRPIADVGEFSAEIWWWMEDNVCVILEECEAMSTSEGCVTMFGPTACSPVGDRTLPKSLQFLNSALLLSFKRILRCYRLVLAKEFCATQ